MQNTIDITRAQLKALEAETNENSHDHTNLGLYVIILLSVFVGLWGSTCLISGLTACTSLNEIGRGLITAAIGI